VKRYDRRRRCGNVGPDAVGIQARRKEWKTRGGSFPRFPRRGISTATLPLLQLGRWGETSAREGEGSAFGYAGQAGIFLQEAKS
jgi:hypothetical protein